MFGRKTEDEAAYLEERAVALRAELQRLDPEREDLTGELERLKSDHALAVHLDGGDLDSIEAREAQVADRLDQIERERSEIAVALRAIPLRLLAAEKEAADAAEKEAHAADVEQRARIADAEAAAVAEHQAGARTSSAWSTAKADFERAERDLDFIESAIAKDSEDPLAELEERHEREALERSNERIAAVGRGELSEADLTDEERARIADHERIEREYRARQFEESRRSGAIAHGIAPVPVRLNEGDGVPQGGEWPRVAR